jgi:hypothetical protein
MTYFLIAIIILLAAFTQATAGFGFALLTMPFLVGWIGAVPAAALVSIVAFTTQTVTISRYRKLMHPNKLWRLIIGAIVGIAIGITILSLLDEQLIIGGLAVFLILYGVYGLSGLKLPKITSHRWDFLIGVLSGFLSGAYNTGGPPFVIYGISRQWEPLEHKANLQLLLMASSITVIILRVISGQYSLQVFQYYLIALPMVLVGTFLGFWLDQYVNEHVFRRILLVMLIALGVRMLFTL